GTSGVSGFFANVTRPPLGLGGGVTVLAAGSTSRSSSPLAPRSSIEATPCSNTGSSDFGPSTVAGAGFDDGAVGAAARSTTCAEVRVFGTGGAGDLRSN